MSTKYKLTGTITQIEETQTFASGFQKREFVVTDGDDKYPQEIKFEVLKDDVNELDSFNEGDLVEVDFNIRGREWEGRYFVNLHCWKLTMVEASNDAPTSNPEALRNRFDGKDDTRAEEEGQSDSMGDYDDSEIPF